jgi:sterol desaturase/sphingolipid hydroxylase (fatty acid hydroxylase superfamily)
MVSKDDLSLLAALFIKLSLAWYLITTSPLLSDFYVVFLVMWASYFILASFLSVYLQKNSQYLLVPSKWSYYDLISQMNISIRDLCILLPVSVMLVQHFDIAPLLLRNPVDIGDWYHSPISWLCIPLGIFLGLICRMATHRLLHVPVLYTKIHKLHHISPQKMTPFSTFNDHPIEFFLMEIVGTFLIPCMIHPLPVPVLAVVWSLQCCLGVFDHCNAIIPGNYFVDSEYHFVHHTLTHYNYAEFQFLDQICGTLYSGKGKMGQTKRKM